MFLSSGVIFFVGKEQLEAAYEKKNAACARWRAILPRRGMSISRRIVLTCIAVLILLPSIAFSRNEKQIVFAMNLPPSFLGEGAADIISYLNILRKGVKQKTGIDLKISTYNSFDAVSQSLKKGDADVAWMSPLQFAKIKASDNGGNIVPLVAMSVAGSTKSATCLFVRRGADIRDLDGLVSSRVAFSDQQGWVVLNEIFDAQKYPFSPFDLFSTHEEITRESAAYALHLKEIDAMVIEQSYLPFIEKSIKGFKKEVTPVACSKPMTNALIVYRKNISAVKAAKLKKVFLSMNKDTAFRPLQKFFRATDARWVNCNTGMYADWFNVLARATRKGWIRDYNRLERVRGGKSE